MIRSMLVFVILTALAVVLVSSQAEAGEDATRVPVDDQGEVLWITVPDIVEDVRFSFERYYVVPASEDRPERAVSGVEIAGKVDDQWSEIRLGIFETDADAKASCDWLFSDVAAMPTPLEGRGRTPAIAVGDEAWELGSSIVFLRGRVLCSVRLDGEAGSDEHVELARAVAQAIQRHPTPHVLVTCEGEPPTIEEKNGDEDGGETLSPPSVECRNPRMAVALPEERKAYQAWLVDLRIAADGDADWYCFELWQGCLIYGRTIVATRGETRVWGDSPEAKYFGTSRTLALRPGIGIEGKLRWGEQEEVTIDQDAEE